MSSKSIAPTMLLTLFVALAPLSSHLHAEYLSINSGSSLSGATLLNTSSGDQYSQTDQVEVYKIEKPTVDPVIDCLTACMEAFGDFDYCAYQMCMPGPGGGKTSYLIRIMQIKAEFNIP